MERDVLTGALVLMIDGRGVASGRVGREVGGEESEALGLVEGKVRLLSCDEGGHARVWAGTHGQSLRGEARAECESGARKGRWKGLMNGRQDQLSVAERTGCRV